MTTRTLRAVEILADAWHDAMQITANTAREAGYQQGWFAGVAEEREAWNRIIAAYADVINHRPPAVRTELRNDACGEKCGRCSRCVRAGAVARYGGDFPGIEVAS
jgi:hypothetical protein